MQSGIGPVALALALALGPRAAEAAGRPSGAPSCSGEYADFLEAIGRETRALEGSAAGGYTYLIRTVATYEHVYYGQGGKLRRRYLRHVRHGTGFAYRVRDGEVLVATNEHVAQHPLVTEGDGDVEGVPAGARKVREAVRIVSSESDDEDGAQVPLTPVMADEALDLAVLKTRHPLRVMPYRIGRSAALRVGNAVQVRGYPLGVFPASNTGRVIATGQPDRERAWRHEDFAIDAPLNSGSSGSPVFAVSCRTGELELVGIYHAGYKDAQALNVVVAVDGLRQALETLRPARRDEPAAERVDRAAVAARLGVLPAPLVMPFGDRAVRVERAGGGVRFALLDAGFPLTSSVEAVLVDRGGEWARPAALVLPARGDRELAWADVAPALREAALRLHEALWRQLAAVVAFRQGELEAQRGRGGRAALSEAAARLRSRRGEQREILQSLDFDLDDPDGVTGARLGTFEETPSRTTGPAYDDR